MPAPAFSRPVGDRPLCRWTGRSTRKPSLTAMGRKRSLSKQISIPETGRSDRTARQRTFATGGNRPSAAAHAREPNDSNVAYCCHPTRESERQKRSEGRRSHLGRFGAPEQKTRVPVSGRSCPAASGRVEMWRGGGRSEHRCCRPFRLAVPYEPDHGSVSTSRSSNWTCRFPASSSRTRRHAFAHDCSRPRAVRRTSPKCPYRCESG